MSCLKRLYLKNKNKKKKSGILKKLHHEKSMVSKCNAMSNKWCIINKEFHHM